MRPDPYEVQRIHHEDGATLLLCRFHRPKNEEIRIKSDDAGNAQTITKKRIAPSMV
jgi:hypothetical protein